MKHVKFYEQKTNDPYGEEREEGVLSKYELNNLFYLIHDIPLDGGKFMDFIESLNLTEEQYRKLAHIFEEVGFQRYDDGVQAGIDQSTDSDPFYYKNI
jgi:hypothetical protein